MALDSKWFFIFLGAASVAGSLSLGWSEHSKEMAKRDVLVACYASGQRDCPAQYERMLKIENENR